MALQGGDRCTPTTAPVAMRTGTATARAASTGAAGTVAGMVALIPIKAS
jgi:hypothetical protein